MEEVGLGLAIVAEVRATVKSLQDRISRFKEEKALVAKADNALTRVNDLSDNINRVMAEKPKAIPEEFVAAFKNTMGNVRASLVETDIKLANLLSQVTPEKASSSSVSLRAWMRRAKQFTRAKSITSGLDEVLKAAHGAESLLHLQLTQLSVAVKADDLEDKIRVMIENYRLPVDIFLPVFNAPALLPKIRLDFDAMDEGSGQYSTPEGKLRHCVYAGMSSRNVTSPIQAVSGVGGVGKTTALIGLGHDPKIRAHFVHGVIFMPLGAAASETSVAKELVKIVNLTEGFSKAFEVDSASSLSEAVSRAAMWFHGKRIMFLIDDISSTPGRPLGYLPDLASLLQGSPESRMVVLTESAAIATKTGSHVHFGARGPRSSVAVAIFMSHAMPNGYFGEEHVRAARRILDVCGGLPILLALAGETIAVRVGTGFRFGSACEKYFQLFSDATRSGVSVLDAAINISLDSLQERAKQDGKLTTVYPFRELYCSLCVLKNHQQARVSVLRRMWKVNEETALEICIHFSSMSLAQLSFEDNEDIRLCIHDLQLDYVRRTAGNTSVEWQRRNKEAEGCRRREAYIEALENELTARYREEDELRAELEKSNAENAELRALTERNLNRSAAAEDPVALPRYTDFDVLVPNARMAVEPANDLSGRILGTSVSTENQPVAVPDSTQAIVGFDFDSELNRFPTDPDDPCAAVNRLMEDEGR